ncbi:metal ABC transporter substrate-binding protein [Alkalihalophilus lindianensis]|uniref:Metal ABC transporter substrate-binding protein n=1 Tax=Alkalihalophilus lindianensis TaxID=1630542 RepID=A0ABU3XF44_9BACI|nr:metal ABC transporter substrate-binding protein [Alkalihalophilus lindianensis]MDV2686515.1 metal ABC transporter substrate-binding protein [Alkalihalophilus lindianensis]
MRKVRKVLLLVVIMVTSLIMVACGGVDRTTENSGELKVITSFSILADITKNVVGDRAEVDYLVPIGEEPHGYEPIPSDFQKASDSSVFYVNGLGLEEWLERLVANAGGGADIITVSDGIDVIGVEGSNEDDPHAWLDVENVITYVGNIRDDLSQRDPEGADEYAANADAYIKELQELDEWIQTETLNIPEEKRTIVISENAFKYFGEAYGYETIGIWELNSHEEGTPGQISRVVDLIQDESIPAVFLETTIDSRFMDTVSSNAGVEIAGEVYTDAVGPSGSGAETYIDMMKHNVNTFVEGLKQ